MTFNEYMELSSRTRNVNSPFLDTMNAVLGLNGEIGEVTELFKKAYFHGKILDREALYLELGDVMFYLAWIIDLNGLDFDRILEKNIDKLKKRWPEGFKSEQTDFLTRPVT